MKYIYLIFLLVILVPDNAYSQVDISNVLNNAETNISGPSGGSAEDGMIDAIEDGDNWEISVHVHLLEEGVVSVDMDYYLPYAYIEVTTEAGYSGIRLINHHIPGAFIER